MELSKSHKYNKSTQEILDAFTSSEEYYKKKYEAMGAKDIEVLEFEQDGDIFRIKTKRAVPANVPASWTPSETTALPAPLLVSSAAAPSLWNRLPHASAARRVLESLKILSFVTLMCPE